MAWHSAAAFALSSIVKAPAPGSWSPCERAGDQLMTNYNSTTNNTTVPSEIEATVAAAMRCVQPSEMLDRCKGPNHRMP
jgi:hypothetical protein